MENCPICNTELAFDAKEGVIFCPNKKCGKHDREPEKCKLCNTILQVSAKLGQFCPNPACDNDTEFGYNNEQQRAAEYILEMTNNEVGAGPDPVGFLIASHEHTRRELKSMARQIAQLKFVMDFPGCGGCPIKGVRDLENKSS